MTSVEDKWTAIYMRISSEGSKDDSQKQALRSYVRLHGLTNARWYRDTATGKNFSRAGWQELMTHVFEGHIHTVVVFRLDRMARNMLEGMNTLGDLMKAKVRVVSLHEQIDMSGVVGQMVAAIILAFAELEREAIVQRIRAGLAARKARGLPMGRRRGCRPKWGLGKRKIDPELATSLRKQGMTVKDIAAKFCASTGSVYAVLRAKNCADGP